VSRRNCPGSKLSKCPGFSSIRCRSVLWPKGPVTVVSRHACLDRPLDSLDSAKPQFSARHSYLIIGRFWRRFRRRSVGRVKRWLGTAEWIKVGRLISVNDVINADVLHTDAAFAAAATGLSRSREMNAFKRNTSNVF